eukprot:847044-Prorocentrum_minimum.AAC.1
MLKWVERIALSGPSKAICCRSRDKRAKVRETIRTRPPSRKGRTLASCTVGAALTGSGEDSSASSCLWTSDCLGDGEALSSSCSSSLSESAEGNDIVQFSNWIRRGSERRRAPLKFAGTQTEREARRRKGEVERSEGFTTRVLAERSQSEGARWQEPANGAMPLSIRAKAPGFRVLAGGAFRVLLYPLF